MKALLATRPHYFAKTAVFLSAGDKQNILQQIAAIETVAALPAYRKAALARGSHPAITTQSQTKGAFMGYDFHITPEGPRLIEINTNAGGAFIVNALERAANVQNPNFNDDIAQMFISEWRAAGRTGPIKTIAIIDEAPEEQFHYPDMLLAADSLRESGFTVTIADPKDCAYDGKALSVNGRTVDLIYNRLTDFDLSLDQNSVVRDALQNDDVVVTPAPRHHAIYADKRNLIRLSDPKLLESWGVAPAHQLALSKIPKTIAVTADNADQLWAQRKQYFFKPDAGFGSRATYRGAKLTRKVWAHISEGGYVAQHFVTPSLRAVTVEARQLTLKFDVRVYIPMRVKPWRLRRASIKGKRRICEQKAEAWRRF
ncbi:hypothetical protein [Robiginitomaculum antarcticum]|uniref:hypothetical protein n=1 Tax=Robiginitomaculum antarcticum TaxID=437507 RepID=UPI0012E9DC39|nr:hypothetical protein [Robiginitomaculum antarcticum]